MTIRLASATALGSHRTTRDARATPAFTDETQFSRVVSLCVQHMTTVCRSVCAGLVCALVVTTYM